ncbi:MAG: mRNA surveillance protein pelota [Methanomicrobiales archaeon]|nr:mRNA surveillance protein pelota [Methanomicrobiales archaeon]
MVPESLDDLWHLSHLIAPGDQVFADTFRSVERATDKIRPEKAEKRPFRIGLRVERVIFQPTTNRVRIAGIIEDGPDLGAHHTISLETGQEIAVIKNWRVFDEERLDRAIRTSTAGAIHILAVEEGEAQLYRMRQYGPEFVAETEKGSGKGNAPEGRAAFLDSVLDLLRTVEGPLVVTGPGFVKEEFATYAQQKIAGLSDRILIFDTRRSGSGSVAEVIGSGALATLTGDLQLQKEFQILQEFLALLAAGKPVAYGQGDVGNAISCGAVRHLLVADSLVRDVNTGELMLAAERKKAEITIFSTEFEPGKQLLGLGGIAAILRFAIY